MYINRKKPKKVKYFFSFVFILILINFIYAEYSIDQLRSLVKKYSALSSEYFNIAKDNIDIVEKLNIALNLKNNKIKEYEEIFKKEKIARLKVHVTVYNPVPEQTDDTPNITAYGKRSRPGITFAASNDIIKSLHLKPGVKMYIPGLPSKAKDGMWIFEDKMHPRWKNRIDLMVKNNFKISKKVVVYIFI